MRVRPGVVVLHEGRRCVVREVRGAVAVLDVDDGLPGLPAVPLHELEVA